MENINYAEAIREALEEKDLLKGTTEIEDGYVFLLPFNAKNLPGIRWNLKVSKSGNSKFWCFLNREIDSEIRPIVLETLNRLNDEYRFLRFALDKDSDVSADYDFLLFGDEEAAIAHVLAVLFMLNRIADKGYLKIMKTIWANSDDEDEDDE